jgi:zinc protease
VSAIDSLSTFLNLGELATRTLANGLRLRVLAQPSAPTTSYYTFFRVGSRNERPGLTGISHLLEHMMFNGAAKYGPKEFDRVLEARGGASNAYTSNDLTVYYDEFASDALDVVVDLESDRMRSLALAPDCLEQEREVVKEERRLRTENSVAGLMEEHLEALMFLAHPYRWPVIGWMSDIESITRCDCVDFFDTYYAPSNAGVYVVGDLDPEATLDQLEASYGDIPARTSPAGVFSEEPPQRGERRANVLYPAHAPALLVGWRGPVAKSQDSVLLEVLQVCLAVGESSRLRRRLLHEEELAVSVHASWGWRIDPGVFLVYAELAPGGRIDDVERAIEEEIARVVSRGIGARELRRAQNLLRSGVLHELATHSGVAHALGQAETLLGDWREVGRSLDRYATITASDVRRAARDHLTSRQKCVVVLEPESKR